MSDIPSFPYRILWEERQVRSVANLTRQDAVEFLDLHAAGDPVDREEWGMYPQTVNAYYSPPMNQIVFPAAILQPPFFNMEADDAVNYGAIGAVIGHEIGHGFDDKGSMFDAEGNVLDRPHLLPFHECAPYIERGGGSRGGAPGHGGRRRQRPSARSCRRRSGCAWRQLAHHGRR